MNHRWATVLIVCVLGSGIVAACAEKGADMLTATSPWSRQTAAASVRLPNGTVRSSVYLVTDTGLRYLRTQEGDQRPTANGQPDASAIHNVGRDPVEIERERRALGIQLAVDRLAPLLIQAASGRRGVAVPSRVRPTLTNGKMLEFGISNGKRVSMQVSTSGDRWSPPGLAVTFLDGRAVSVVRTAWTKRAGQYVPLTSETTVLDQHGRPTLVLAAAYSYTADIASSVRDVFGRVGAAALRFVQPDALGAATMRNEEACTTELAAAVAAVAFALEKAGAAAAADAALAAATLLCASVVEGDLPGLAACAQVPGLTTAATAASAAAVAATALSLSASANYAWCEWKAAHPPIVNTTGGGGGGTGNFKCPDIQWYVSYDDGATWEWFDTTSGGNNCEEPM